MLAKKEEMTKSNEVFVKQAASAGINRIRNLFLPIGKYLPAIGTYYSVYKSGVDGQLNNKEKRELENFRENQELLKQKINNLEEVSAVDKAKYSSMANQISERASPLPLIKDIKDIKGEVINLNEKKSRITEELKKITELESLASRGVKLSEGNVKLVSNKASLLSDMNYYDRQLKETTKKLDQAIEGINKSSILNIDFNFEKFVESLTVEEKLAFCGLVFNHLILTNTITIILILYGDYLLKRFDLVNKYPKIAKFIQLRKKFQGYYLKISFLWIFLCVLPQMSMYIFLLLPKINSIIS